MVFQLFRTKFGSAKLEIADATKYEERELESYGEDAEEWRERENHN